MTSRFVPTQPVRLVALVCATLLATYALSLGVAATRGYWIWRPGGGFVASDFVAYYAAGRMVLEGQAAAIYDWAAHHAVSVRLIGPFRDDLPWLNPPHFLLFVTPFAALPYCIGMMAWIAATTTAFAAAVSRILGNRLGIPLALSFPAVLINAGSGQAGLLNAALFGAALVTMPTRPILAGIFFGALTIKPQLGLLVPLALLAGGQWRTVASAVVTTLVLAALTALLLPASLWPSFFGSLAGTGQAVVEQGLAGWTKMQSFYGVLRGLGLPSVIGWTGALISAFVASLLVIYVWQNRYAYEIKASTLALASLLAQPYVFIYDEAMLGIALAFLLRLALRTRFLPYEIVLFGLVYLPLIQAVTISKHFGLLAALIVLVSLLRRMKDGPEPALA